MQFWNRNICRILKTFLSHRLFQDSMPLVLSPWSGMPFLFIISFPPSLSSLPRQTPIQPSKPSEKGTSFIQLSPVPSTELAYCAYYILSSLFLPLLHLLFWFAIHLFTNLSVPLDCELFQGRGCVLFISESWHRVNTQTLMDWTNW